MKFRAYLCLIFFVVTNQLQALDLGKTLKDDFNSTVDDFVNLPKILNLSHFFYASQLVIADAIIMTNDEKMREYVLLHKCSCNEDYLKVVNYFGQAIALPFVVYGIGFVSDNPSWRKTGRLLAESMLLSGLITQSFKVILSRSRPFNNESSYKFKFFEFEDKYWSHPSVHSTLAFSFATILAFRVNTWWSYPLFYGLATSTGFARMYFDKHWLSDVFMGAAIGTASSLLILRSSDRSEFNSKSGNLSIQPSFNFINFTYSW